MRRLDIKMKVNLKTKIIDVALFLICYLFSLMINMLLGFGSIAFGGLIVYSFFFLFLECIQLLFFNKYIQIVFFFINSYLSYCFGGIFFAISTGNIIWKSVLNISLDLYLMLIGISLIMSIMGYIVLFVRWKRKDI